MAILTFPNIVPDNQVFGIQYNTQVSSNELSGVTNTVEIPGARWNGSLSFIDMTPTQAAALKSFLLELRGSAGRFFYGDQSQTSPFNIVAGSLTIDSPSTNRIIRTTLGASSPSFSQGDYIQIGTDDSRELKMILSSTNVSGDTYDLVVEPLIRRIDYLGLPIIYSSPVTQFFLTSSDQASWGIRSKAFLSDINIDFVEAFA